MTDKTVANTAAAGGRVLVVDDDELSRRLLCDILTIEGYAVSVAADGEEALREVGLSAPDVLLLDVMMPRLDGLEVCRRLKADALTAPIPVLLVTALHERADRLKGIASGANDFITKPIDTAEVLLRVRNALRTKRLYDERCVLLRMREDLSDMIVHDIRNPLLAISLCAHSLKAKDAPPPVARLAEAILDQTHLLESFIGDLLTAAKMEQGRLTLQHAQADLAELGRAAFRNQQMMADAINIRLELVAPEGPCLAEVDPRLIARLLDNLLANALKFAPDHTAVTLRILPADGAGTPHRIRVEDEGPGIPLGYHETIFDKFGVVEMKALQIPQTGLGLALCRMVAEAHGGRIFVEPRQPHGSIFTVELP
jgi:signal transduction histidine kinase